MKTFLLVSLFFAMIAPTAICQTIITVAGSGSAGFFGDGEQATMAKFNTPSGITSDRFGNFYIADDINNVIHVVRANGLMERFAGNGSSGLAGDEGTATDAQLQLNWGTVGMTVDTFGNIYFADGSRIRMVGTDGIVHTVAGNGIYGFSGDNGAATAAKLASPAGICFDKFGNLFVADEFNANIRKISISGTITTVGGTGSAGYTGDGGPATAAKLSSPLNICVDDSLNIFFTDNYRLRKIDRNGIISTLAGNDTFGTQYCHDCPASSIKLICPAGITVDNLGNLFLADCANQLIYHIDLSLTGNDLVGNGSTGFSGDGGAALSASLNAPTSLCLDRDKNLLFIDKSNYRVRKVFLGTNEVPSQPSYIIALSPNPTSGSFTLTLPQTTGATGITVYDMLGKIITTSTINGPGPVQFHLVAPPATYIVQVVSAGTVWRQKLVIR